MKMIIAKIATIVVVLVVVIPFAINECYKHGGYVTLWDASDVLSYYGSVLGATIAVTTLIITILFTRKQIERDAYLKKQTDYWATIEGIFIDAIKKTSPIYALKNTVKCGQANPMEAIRILREYQMDCHMAMDNLLLYISPSAYLKVRQLATQIQTASDEYSKLADEMAAAYELQQKYDNRRYVERGISIEEKEPGSFSKEQILCMEQWLKDSNELSEEEILQKINNVNQKMLEAYANIYQPLLMLKRTVFEQIENEIQKEADSILRLWRK